MQQLEHGDVFTFLAAHVGRKIEYKFGTTPDWRAAKTVRATVATNYPESESVIVSSVNRRGQPVEEHFKCPHEAYAYFEVAALTESGTVENRMVGQPEPEAKPPSSEEQRAQIVHEVRASSALAQEERKALFDWMKAFEEKAADERRAAAAAAESQRLAMLAEQRQAAAEAKKERETEAKKAEHERTMLLQTLQALQRGVPPPTAAQNQSARSARATPQDDDDGGEATDVDDEDSCIEALAAWKNRTKSTPKRERYLVAWYAAELEQEAFANAWSRKMGVTMQTAGVRDDIEAKALLSVICDLQRTLTSPTLNVGRYAVTSALRTVMEMAQRLEMRVAKASYEALAEFDVQLSNVDKKARRRATDYATIEQVAEAAKRKHPRKNRDRDREDRRRNDRRGGRGGQPGETDSQAPADTASRSSSVASTRTPAAGRGRGG